MKQNTITLRAPAKINLFLDITGKRPDGYHTITGVMHTVGLYDLVTVSRFPMAEGQSPITLTCTRSDLPVDRGNIGYRAAEAFLSAVGEVEHPCFAVSIHIDKHIPAAAGMAGGSTDAAAVLKGLNTLWGEPLDTQALCKIGVTLGADVPFCIVGGAQVTEGIGERLTPVRSLPSCHMVVACGGEGVSTPGAYGELDRMFGDFDGRLYAPESARLTALLSALESGDMEGIASSVYNVFEYAVLPRHSVAGRLKEIMMGNGATLALMSGSGPSVFGVFFTEDGAKAALRDISQEGIPAWLCE